MSGNLKNIRRHISVFDFADYGTFLQQVYDYHKERSNGYTILKFAEDLGLGHNPSMHLIMKGNRKLTEKTSEKIAAHYQTRAHRVITIDLRQFGGSALTSDVDVPKDRDETRMSADIPITYVPARNTIFLSYALAWAEVIDCDDVFIGVNALDYSGYPDCRPEFIAGFEDLARLATRDGDKGVEFRIHAPLQHMTKADIAAEAARLGMDAGMSWSCYDPTPEGRPCGQCDSCRLRAQGFADAGLVDTGAA